MTRLINIDNGGTLTDFCLVDGGDVRYTKTLTTPYDLSRCLFDGLTKVSELVYGEPQLAALLQSTDYIRYSTTQGTNALVQRAGPRLGLLLADSAVAAGLAAATRAQEDLLAALVGDRWAVISLEKDDDALSQELVTRVNDLSARGARRLVVAVSGVDGADAEARIKRLLLKLYPRHLLGAVPLLFSWELVADSDDIRRTWSSLLNAFLHPAMELFLFNADRRLRDARARQPLRIFRNDGGSSRVSKSAALKTYSSGPRGGLEGTRALASHYGLRHLVMVDVGGTTTDIGVVTDGAIRVDRRGMIDDAPSSLELAAITSYGVGGSSIFRVVDGQIQVGPDSVGAAPGPACFGLGGDEATLTDVPALRAAPARRGSRDDQRGRRAPPAGGREEPTEGADPGQCTARFRLTVERGDTESVIDLADPQDAAAHLRHSDRASLELALLAPLPHVTLGQAGDIACRRPGGRQAAAARWPRRPYRGAGVRPAEPAAGGAGVRARRDRRSVLHHAGPRGMAVRHHRRGRPAPDRRGQQ